MTSPEYPLRDRHKLFHATVTPSLLYASRNVDDDGRTEDEPPENVTTDEEDDHTDKEKTGKGHAVAHAASVDDSADVEPHDPDNEPVDDTTEHNNQDLSEHDKSSHDAGAKRTTCWQQAEARRGSSGRARFTGGRQG